ncbi:hypothetical protein MBM_00454 [Drepanopeziza brunnea f. sp. 'multigermtubi' MB_m1]|uniref:Uncharacterized protein n=2 Tax=Drepanopeziza brunnea f. sp. 'multigermtubi' TaxID=698441 RepID=K1X8E0_MARBU|nr:uncharacterized protein MBM_00454 [Drepanopeziza brunnea f. sp. 'multigermtubi' MB_m1]EKD21341.1 hypothetical protein MBM_00454 [Drepanopeziza brunnea f. sp. 'multigermtubi' MB_m1]
MASTKSVKLTSPPSASEIYSVARVASEKLVQEAARKNLCLRRLVAHANLYDTLLDEYSNYSYLDSESDSDSDTGADSDELPVQSCTAHMADRDSVEIHVESTYVYQDQQLDIAIGRGDVLIEEMDDLGLCKVTSHSENVRFATLPSHVEVEILETEIFDDD